jgi:hypothetical protein
VSGVAAATHATLSIVMSQRFHGQSTRVQHKAVVHNNITVKARAVARISLRFHLHKGAGGITPSQLTLCKHRAHHKRETHRTR